MKKEFNKSWEASKQPRKQRKYIAKAPLSTRKKFMNSNLSKDLRKKYGKRSFPLKKGDTVKIMNGKFKKRTGKITEINLKRLKVIVEGIQIKKQDGSKANIKMQPSNLQIIELNLEDQKRKKSLERKLGEVEKKK
jgi:large subunit ribosomal protein L24